jgi:NO-binding membrane sensor protein with MHYT domain
MAAVRKENGMQSVATGLLGIGLVVTCLAGFRVLLFAVDLVTGVKHRDRMQAADVILLALALAGVALLALGAVLLHQAVPAR